jgi:CBS domain-containing protein
MREHAVRRVPVVDEGKPVGIVSLTDLVRGPGEAAEREVLLTLADIASAPSDDPSTEAHPKASAAWETVWDVPAMAPAVGRRTTGAGGGHAPPSR